MRLGELPDVSDIRCHWLDFGSVDVMSWEIQALDSKLAHCGVVGDAVGGETLENDFRMAAMFILVCTRDENVVNVHEDEGQVAEDVPHEALK